MNVSKQSIPHTPLSWLCRDKPKDKYHPGGRSDDLAELEMPRAHHPREGRVRLPVRESELSRARRHDHQIHRADQGTQS